MRLWVAALVVCLGCGPEVDAELIPIDSVRPRWFEPGARIEIAGTGFPVGRDATVRFEGEVRAPGALPRRVEVMTRGRAVAADRVELVAGERLIAALGGRGTFLGSVIVGFEGHGGTSRVRGTLADAELVVSPSSARRLDEDADRDRDARAVLSRIGLAFTDEPPADGGLRVESVREGGAAARAGVRAEDRVLALDGMSLIETSDFVPAPGAERITLRLDRRGQAAPIEVTLDVESEAVAAAPEDLARTAVPIAILVLVLVFLAPTARVFEAIERSMRGMLQARESGGLSLRESLLALGASMSIAAAFGTRAVRERIDVVSIVLLAVIAHAAARAAASPGVGGAAGHMAAGHMAAGHMAAGHMAVGHMAAGRMAAGHLVGAVGAVVPLLAAVLAAGLASGSVRVEGLVEAQGGAPWTWNAFRTPVLAALVVLFVRHALDGAGGERSLPLRVVGSARLLAMGMVAAIAFFGGWHVPGWEPIGRAAADPIYLATAGAVLVLKAWIVVLVAARVQPRHTRRPVGGGPSRMQWALRTSAAPVLGVVGLALTAGGAALDPPRSTEALVAAATFLAAGAITLVALARSALGRTVEPQTIVHPFV